MVFVLAVGGIIVFACIAHARHNATMRVMRDAIRAGGSKPSATGGTESTESTESTDTFGSSSFGSSSFGSSSLGSSSLGSSSFGSSQPDAHSIAHAKAHFGLNSHGEALVAHHGMDPHSAALHGGSDTGGIGGGGIGGTGHDT